MFQKISLEKNLKKIIFFRTPVVGMILGNTIFQVVRINRGNLIPNFRPQNALSALCIRRSNADSFRKSFWATTQENHASLSHFRMLPVKNRALPSTCDTDLVPSNQRMAKCDRSDHSNLEKPDGPFAWFLPQIIPSTSEITTPTEMSIPMRRGTPKMSLQKIPKFKSSERKDICCDLSERAKAP